jgi:hypothetical protein
MTKSALLFLPIAFISAFIQVASQPLLPSQLLRPLHPPSLLSSSSPYIFPILPIPSASRIIPGDEPFPPKKMSDLPITSKDQVNCTTYYSAEDLNTSLCTGYSRWVLGSARGNDILYLARIMGDSSPSEHSLEQIQEAFLPVPADRMFPQLPFLWWWTRTTVTVADDWDEEPSPDIYLKRPFIKRFEMGEDFLESAGMEVAMWFAQEIKQLEQLARFPPHPNLVRYHGCRVRKGRVTAALLGRVPGNNLWDHLQDGKTVDKEPFLAALASAVDYLHNVVGLVHNDLHPGNIMVSPDGVPTLIDMGAALPVGDEMHVMVP